MIKINNSTVRIISAVAIAIVLTASGLITFFNEESTFDNDSDTEYEIPADDRRDTVQSDTSFPDVSYPDTSVSSSDASKNATVSASDLPVNSDVQEEPDVPAEEKIKIKIVKIKTTANLRAGKSTNSEKIATLVKGTEWEFIKESGSRYQIKYSGKKTGWIPISCADLIEKEITIKHIGKYISREQRKGTMLLSSSKITEPWADLSPLFRTVRSRIIMSTATPTAKKRSKSRKTQNSVLPR